MTASVGVIGLGLWGTALAHHLDGNGNSVMGWTRNADTLKAITDKKPHPKFKKQLSFSERFRVTNKLKDLSGTDVIVLAVPARALAAVTEQIDISKFKAVVSAIKGLVPESDTTPLAYLVSHRSGLSEKLAVLSGPSFANDLINHRPVSVVIASKKIETARFTAELFAGPSFRVYTSEDPIGVELGGIVKNVLAIAAGVSDSLGFGPSARAGLITRGLSEMMRFSAAIGADSRTITGLSGLGDLVMTATDDQSRNRQIGLRLGRGETLEHALSELGSEAEGVWSAPLLLQLAGTYGIEMPITSQVTRLLQGQIDPRQLAGELLSRPLKSEF